MADPRALSVFVVAGEASGDRLGADVMAGLKELSPGVTFEGVGGPMMQAQGLRSQFPYDELSVMGLAEVLPKYRHLKRRIRETADAVLATKPDVLLTIDSPDFSLRVARLVRAVAQVRTVHYVAPSVWAWRAGRAAKMAKVIDQVLALLPFEPPLMEAAGMRCDFVGHPVASASQASPDEIAVFRAKYDLEGPVILALPGSRRGEVSRLGDEFGDALHRFQPTMPGARVVVPTVGHLRETVEQITSNWPIDAVVVGPEDKRAAFGAAEIALAASGTVSLELAAAQVPMVIAYDMNFLTREILKRMVKIDTVTLVNLVSETRAVPEFLFQDCTAAKIAAGLAAVRADPAPQLAAMALTMERLGRDEEPGGLRAARAILSGLGREG